VTSWWRDKNAETIEFLENTNWDDIEGPDDFPRNEFCSQCFEETMMRWEICLKNKGTWVFDSQVKQLRKKTR